MREQVTTVQQFGELVNFYRNKLHAKDVKSFYVLLQPHIKGKEVPNFLEKTTLLQSESLVLTVLVASKGEIKADAWKQRSIWEKFSPTGDWIQNGTPVRDEILVC
jgi:hypothetical protein